MLKGKVRLRIDCWPSRKEVPVGFEKTRVPGLAEVDPTVETSEWRSIPPQESLPRGGLDFIHGVRRVEARVLAERDTSIFHGLFGSLVAGAARLGEPQRGAGPGVPAPVEPEPLSGSEATDWPKWQWTRHAVRRFLILGGGLDVGRGELRLGKSELVFESYTVAVNSPAEVVLALHELMRKNEAELAQAQMLDGCCVFVNGPLSCFPATGAPMVAVIRRISRPYLDVGRFSLVPNLRPGERTPLFALSDAFCRRFSWFLRTAPHPPFGHLMAGIVRLEVRSTVGLERAQVLADLSARNLPHFAARPSQDPLPGLNSLPIPALEGALARHLGDVTSVRGAIFEQLSQGLAA